jgi:glycine/D-amino acid oxidase-like deaminating enzyme
MIPSPDAVASDAELPRKVDVVVIGGGIVGVTSALFLARKGLQVALCEKGEIAAEQSSRNWGWVRVMGRDRREIPLALLSQRLWEELSTQTAVDTGFRRAGIVNVFDTERMRESCLAWADLARDYQVGAQLLGRKELQAMVPGIDPQLDGGLFLPSDCKAEPQSATSALAELARREGVTILTRCAVRGVETAGGKISGVVTENGVIRAEAVLLAGGAWSRLFLGNLGIDLPLLLILGSVARVSGIAGLPETTVGGSKFAYRKRLDGGYTVAQRNASISEITPDSFRLFRDYLPGWKAEWRDLKVRPGRRFAEEWKRKRTWALDERTAFEETRVLNPIPNAAVIRGGMAHLQRIIPAFRDARVTDSWGGMMDVTPDAVPVIGPVETIPGLFVAAGFSGHGFGIGPGAGKLMADLITGATPLVDPAPYRLDRFARTRASLAARRG